MFLEQWCLVVLREDPRGYGEGDWAGCMWRGINGRLIVPWMAYSRATQEQLPRGYYRSTPYIARQYNLDEVLKF